ncbi:hypothetical protein [Brevundimonas aurifodinae]|uniref:Circularly permuted type 2 ATP-grasp protein n=1 Tax=Brevundimonas aurifodinae TaxID=1508312 RepID=A0ABV1NK43_9CAUL
MSDLSNSAGSTRAEQLNGGCFCIGVDQTALAVALDRETGISGFAADLAQTHPWLFARSPVFLPTETLDRMMAVVAAAETAVMLPAYRDAAAAWTPPFARRDAGPRGVFMGYDFHVTPSGPKLIEINTNAGGAFLNAVLARSQQTCCAGVVPGVEPPGPAAFQQHVGEMFRDEWRLQNGEGTPGTVAILDDDPQAQPLYPEFRLAQAQLRAAGLETLIGDPRDLMLEDGALTLGGVRVDIVYNRLVDFLLEQPAHAVLRQAYEQGLVVVTPNPHVYSRLADKQNLTLLSDPESLSRWGLTAEQAAVLAAAVPLTVLVRPENTAELWADRRNWFFKPVRGHASKATYRGAKLTRRVWKEIKSTAYVAQAYAAPGERRIPPAAEPVSLKVDVRLYTYGRRLLLAAARLYQGQTTNMRTPGGGFAPVLLLPAVVANVDPCAGAVTPSPGTACHDRS